MNDLKERVVIITGAGSGIGAALAKGFSRAGARVTLAGRRKENLEATAAECAEEHLCLKADITEPQGRRDILEKTLERWGRIDILVNNAGIGAYGPFLDTTEEEWRRLFEINLFAPVFLTREVLRSCRPGGKGSSSIWHPSGDCWPMRTRWPLTWPANTPCSVFPAGWPGTWPVRVSASSRPHLTDTEFFSASGGAREMAPEVKKYQRFMDTPEAVAQGILEHLDSERLVVFPTDKPARAYEKQRDI